MRVIVLKDATNINSIIIEDFETFRISLSIVTFFVNINESEIKRGIKNVIPNKR